MKILLTGATGYIGKRLLPILVEDGHQVYCCVRNKARFSVPENFKDSVHVIEVDFLKKESVNALPKDIDAAYYLIHSMSGGKKDFDIKEGVSATHFRDGLNKTNARHVIYLSGIINEDKLSKHLASRQQVEEILHSGKYHCTTLRAGIIIGSGSASFEIMRDLVEKLPIMVAPKWLNTLCQPIAIYDVLTCLTRSLGKEELYDKNFDIGGPDVLTYKEMLLEFASVRKLKRRIFTIPVMTPRLSSYWLYFVTSTSYSLATSLVDSMKVNVVCRNDQLIDFLDIDPLSYRESLERAFMKIEQNHIVSSWKDSLVSGLLPKDLSDYIEVPQFGCLTDTRVFPVKDEKSTLDKIFSLGGTNGWPYGNFLWKIRGLMDKMVGGVGLRRGRTHPTKIHAGDALDFWRVLFADRDKKRLLLFAEMKVPGEAWLEFSVEEGNLIQKATFRPRGIWGRLYWYLVSPMHEFVFKGMARRLAS